MKDRKKPAIRFKGFTEDWEQRKLDDFVTFYSGLTYSPKDIRSEGTLVLRSSNVKDGEVIDADNVYVDSAIVNSENVQERDIIVVVRNGSRALIGKHAEIKGFKPNTVIGAFMTGIRSEHSSFLNALLNTPHFNKEIAINMGATINQITGYMFSKMEFLIPSANEQDEIGEYFKNLDYLITLHQRKYDKLVNVKKSMLEKMFPRDGKFVPDVRFSGFTEDWEQRKLGDVVGITSGFMGDSLLSDGKYHLTRIETIADGIVDENRVGYSNEKPDDMYLLKHGDILYSNINSISHMGKVAKYQGNSPLYHGINLLRLQPENNINSDFLLYLLNTEKCRNWAKTRANQAVSQASINQSLLTTQEIAISSFEEQKKIGDYFRNLDNLITLHQRKLEKLKNIKKSCLVKMFI